MPEFTGMINHNQNHNQLSKSSFTPAKFKGMAPALPSLSPALTVQRSAGFLYDWANYCPSWQALTQALALPLDAYFRKVTAFGQVSREIGPSPQP